MNAKNYDSKVYCTVNEALKLSGFHNPYLRKLLKEGKIEAHKENIPGTEIPRWLISRESLNEYIERGAHTQRADGRNKFTLYLNPAEESVLREVLTEHELEHIAELLRRANPPKSAR